MSNNGLVTFNCWASRKKNNTIVLKKKYLIVSLYACALCEKYILTEICQHSVSRQ